MSSYRFNGRYFRSAAERDQAAAEYYRQEAARRAEIMQQETTRLENRIGEQARELTQARGDIRRQMQINQAIQADTREMQRRHADLRRAQQEMEARMERELDDARQCLLRTNQNVTALEKNHRQHVEQVRRQFQEVDIRITKGLQEAEKQRADTEKRLNHAIGEVNQKVEAERQERLSQKKNDLERAEEQIQFAREIVARHKDDYARLDLTGDARSNEILLSQAGTRLREGHPQALAASDSAFTSALSLEEKALRRDAELEQTRHWLKESAKALAKRCEDKEVSRMFAPELVQLKEHLAGLRVTADRDYQDYAGSASEKRRHERFLADLESHVTTMVATASILSQMDASRESVAVDVVEKLEAVYGPAETNVAYVVPSDPKSPLVVKCDFGETRVNCAIGLDKRLEVSASSLHDNATCGEMARKVIQVLGPVMEVTQQQEAPDRGLEPPAFVAQPTEQWQGIGRRLQGLRP